MFRTVAVRHPRPMVTRRNLENQPADQALHSLLSQATRQATLDLRRMVGTGGLPVEFWRVLEVLADAQGRSMSALAEQAGMLLPATCKLIDRMTEAALIQRAVDPQDQRRVILHISDLGLQKVAALREDVRAHQDRLGSSFGPEREAQLRALLNAFIQAHR